MNIGPDGKGRTEAISRLLTEAEAAHGAYETTVLGGVYDKDWAAWYATYAVEHGIGELVGRPITAERLATLLADAFEAFKAVDPALTESWATWTAGRLLNREDYQGHRFNDVDQLLDELRD